MLAGEFAEFIASADIDRAMIFRPTGESAWSIYGYGETLPPETINHLAIDKDGSKRLWADLDAAYAFIRKTGFKQTIEIEGRSSIWIPPTSRRACNSGGTRWT